ncbi:MAG: hypothetical protein D6723_03085 [Acidobacteria bacterium]|nr:MAG: hypothetical protein D6723_03085 [Acidobacteriota bacterium]
MMNHRLRSPCALALIWVLLFGLPLTERAEQKSAPRPTDAQQELFDALRRRAFDAFYNLDYETAQKLFQQIVEELPDHPAGYLYLATQVWVGELNRTRRLQTSIYSNPSFYSRTGETVDPQVDQQFREYIQKAIEKAKARLAQNEGDVEARYFLGAAYAVLASYEATVARQFMAALKHARRAVSEHRKVIKQQPNFVDAYLTIGAYDYIVGSLPLWVKLLAALGGIRGNKERGIKELQQAAERGKYVSDDARVVLIAIYAREKQYEKALELVRYLRDRYPRNYYFPIEEAHLLVEVGRKREGFAAFEAMLQNERFQEVGDLIRFQYAQLLAEQGYRIAALHYYRQVTEMPTASPQLVTLAHLRIGQLLDLLGRRQEAISEYQLVLDRENVFDSHRQAERYLRRPYTGNE